MELTGAIEAIASMKTDAPMTIISDSQYLVKGMNEWLPGWKQRGWQNTAKKPVANQDLWKRLDGLVMFRKHGVIFEWVRGHDGDAGNEEADSIATAEAKKAAARAERQGRG
jgi:ribonuclease HI